MRPVARFYVLQIMLKYLFASLGIFVSILLIINLAQLAGDGLLLNFSAYFFGKSVLCMLPNLIGTTFPFAFLLAVLMALGQMSGSGEIIAFRAGGYSFFDIFSPAFVLSVLSCFFLICVNNWLAPSSMKRSKDYAVTMLNKISSIDLKPHTFREIGEWSIYARKVSSITGGMHDVKLIQRQDRGEKGLSVTRVSASSGKYKLSGSSGLTVELSEGRFINSSSSSMGKVVQGTFDSYSTVIPFKEDSAARKPKSEELTTAQIVRKIKDGDIKGSDVMRFKTEAWSRFVFSFSPLLFFLIGAPLGVGLDKLGKSSGFSTALIVSFAYYGLTICCIMFSRKYTFLYPWAMWAPTLLAGAAGFYLWRDKLSGR